MQFEWDDDKAQRNFEKHGVLFEEAKTVFTDPLYVVFRDREHSVREERFLIFGESSQKQLLVVAYTERNEVMRIISARLATRKERRAYEEEL